MTLQVAIAFPGLAEQVAKLVKQHSEIDDEMLLLAVYYQPEREPGDVFLFEVIDNFGGGRVDEDGELFEGVFFSTSGFVMADGQKLHLVMTNPQEMLAASEQQWPSFEEVRAACRAGRYRRLHSQGEGAELMGKLLG